MLPASKLKIIQELIDSSSRDELIWLNGYLAGIVGQSLDQDPIPASQVSLGSSTGKITIAYGTETGNAKKLATDFAAMAKKHGVRAKLVSLDQYRLNDLSHEEFFFTVISTQGDGEPPDAAKKFYHHIHQNGFKLDNLKFGVLALGDTAYPLFCKAGEDVDSQLHKLGAERIISLRKCDTDYASEADQWFTQVLKTLQGVHFAGAIAEPLVSKKSTAKIVYTGTVLTNVNLNDYGSNKETRHVELAAEEADYQPGDSIGIVPENPAIVVQAILELVCADSAKMISFRNEQISLFHLLQKKLNIVYLPERVVKNYASLIHQHIPQTKIGLLDLLKIYPVRDLSQFEDVLSILEPTVPRLYSIASSPQAHPGEIHLTVAKDTFQVNQETKHGLCSDFLSQLEPGSALKFYVHRNASFRLPGAAEDLIMIGPGTGIAPFRSFLAERDATGAPGRNWLFFGDQHFATDFLYQTEIQDWKQTGVLTQVDLAFSRDQAEKIYVQDKMKKHGAELFDWIEKGAYVCLCGAKEPMSVDVENALVDIIQKFGNRSGEAAQEYLQNMKASARYLTDVY